MTTPESILAQGFLLPDLKLLEIDWHRCLIVCEKVSPAEVCPRCATLCQSTYDHRWVKIRDGLIRGRVLRLKIKKRRFFCKTCQKPFTEPVEGILPRRKSTQRMRREIRQACETFVDLKTVRETFQVSNDTVYRALYEQLKYSAQERINTPWPSRIGLDEHGWKRREFVTMVVNQAKQKRNLIELVLGKSREALERELAHIPGRENVKVVSMDMCESFRNFSASFFPQAKRVADKFHVLRLLSGPILKKRRSITGTNADRKARGLLLMNSKRLDYFERLAIRRYLEKHPELAELYSWKERLHSFYEIRGQRRAELALHQMTEKMKESQLPEIKRLRRTLLNWREEVLNYFQFRITNAAVEGFNNKASLVRHRAYGYRSHTNYRLRLLSACR